MHCFTVIYFFILWTKIITIRKPRISYIDPYWFMCSRLSMLHKIKSHFERSVRWHTQINTEHYTELHIIHIRIALISLQRSYINLKTFKTYSLDLFSLCWRSTSSSVSLSISFFLLLSSFLEHSKWNEKLCILSYNLHKDCI